MSQEPVDAELILPSDLFSTAFEGASTDELLEKGGTLLAIVSFFAHIAEKLKPFVNMVPASVSEIFTSVIEDEDVMDSDPLEILDKQAPNLGKALFGSFAMLHECIHMMQLVFEEESDLILDCFSMEDFLVNFLVAKGVDTPDAVYESVQSLMSQFSSVQTYRVNMDGEE